MTVVLLGTCAIVRGSHHFPIDKLAIWVCIQCLYNRIQDVLHCRQLQLATPIITLALMQRCC